MVRRTRECVMQARGFRDVQIVARSANLGLACNIAQGVGQVCADRGRIIVLEDDLVTAPHFLRFMNQALERYEHEPRIWHINGWNYPMETRGLPDAYTWRLMHCWGWATWADRWAHYQKNPADLLATWSASDIQRFNLDGAQDFWAQVRANAGGQMNTWAVFWYATLFRQGGLCLSPAESLTLNTGLDGSGANCTASDAFQGELSGQSQWQWPVKLEENAEAVARARRYASHLRGSLPRRWLSQARGAWRQLTGRA